MYFQHFNINILTLFLLFFMFFKNPLPTLSCLPCDKDTDAIKEDFLHFIKKEHGPPEIFTSLYNDFIGNMEERRLDQLGIKELSKEFRHTVKSIEDAISKGGRFREVLHTKFEELTFKTEIIFATFEKERACPNLKDDFNCGIIEQKVIQCGTCTERNMVCVGGTNKNKCDEYVAQCPMCVCHEGSCHHKRTGKPCHPCKDYQKCLDEVLHCKDEEIQVAEGEQLLLDCSLKFLNSVNEEIEYVLEKRNEIDVQYEKTSTNSHFYIPKADKKFSGQYICTARSKESTFPISRVGFTVTVVSPPMNVSPPTNVSPPSNVPPPPEINIKNNKWVRITVIVGSVISFVIIGSIVTCLGLLTLEKHNHLNVVEKKRANKPKEISKKTKNREQKVQEKVKIQMDIEESKPTVLEEVKIPMDIEESKTKELAEVKIPMDIVQEKSKPDCKEVATQTEDSKYFFNLRRVLNVIPCFK